MKANEIRLMKHVLWYIILLGFISCKQSNHLDNYIKALPDSTLINDAISSVVMMDSLKQDYKITEALFIPTIYKWTKWTMDAIPPPPPQIGSISYDELYIHFDVKKDIVKKNDDSTFIKLQTDTTRKFFISSDILKQFNNSSTNFYLFYLPIFSFDKQMVLIQYWRHCGSLCGSCYQTLLKKVGSKWVKVHRWNCGRS
jgi:hypothetical protein